MIMSDECFLRARCKKYIDDKCECKHGNIFCTKLFRINYLYNEALLTDNQRKHIDLRLDADGTDKQAFTQLKAVQDNIEQFVETNSNLFIHSSICGNGKTAWAVRLLQTYFERIWYKCDFSCKGLFINVPRFLLALKDSIGTQSDYIDHIKTNVLTADIVVWDEVGVKALTAFEHENLLNLINSRIDAGKSNIYTSNLTPAELREKIGERLYSRVVNYSTNIEFFGSDKRSLR